jgi:hypothetical protein
MATTIISLTAVAHSCGFALDDINPAIHSAPEEKARPELEQALFYFLVYCEPVERLPENPENAPRLERIEIFLSVCNQCRGCRS